MEQKRIARALKIFAVFAGAVAGCFFFLYVPVGIWQIAQSWEEVAWLRWPGTIGMWAIALQCYLALAEFWRICGRIGRDNSFCRENAASMHRMGIYAFVAAALMVGGTIFLKTQSLLSGPIVIAVFFSVSVAVSIGVVCVALSLLIENAARLKEENDLTI